MREAYTETTNAIAAAVPCDAGTVRTYCDLGLLDYQRLANGIRLMKPSAAGLVREIRSERLARRGGRHGAQDTV